MLYWIKNLVKKTINLENQIKEQKLKIETLEKEKNESEKDYMDIQKNKENYENINNEKYEKALKENLENVQNLFNKNASNKKEWNKRNMREENMSFIIISNWNANINNNYSNNMDNGKNLDNWSYSNTINIINNPQDAQINKNEIFNILFKFIKLYILLLLYS